MPCVRGLRTCQGNGQPRCRPATTATSRQGVGSHLDLEEVLGRPVDLVEALGPRLGHRLHDGPVQAGGRVRRRLGRRFWRRRLLLASVGCRHLGRRQSPPDLSAVFLAPSWSSGLLSRSAGLRVLPRSSVLERASDGCAEEKKALWSCGLASRGVVERSSGVPVEAQSGAQVGRVVVPLPLPLSLVLPAPLVALGNFEFKPVDCLPTEPPHKDAEIKHPVAVAVRTYVASPRTAH